MAQIINKIGIIGGGNMGLAIALGLVKSGSYKHQDICISSLDNTRLAELKERGFATSKDNLEIIKLATYIILAVKPYHIANVCKSIAQHLQNDQYIISVAAGYPLSQLEKDLSHDAASNRIIYRVMPNTAIAIGESFTGISSNSDANPAGVIELFDKVGETLFLDESLLDAITILSGSGIAYVFRFIRAAMQGGTGIGLKPEDAKKIFAQTMIGAASLILAEDNHPEKEIDKVTTPNGTTIAGLNAMEKYGFSNAVIQGITDSFKVLKK